MALVVKLADFAYSVTGSVIMLWFLLASFCCFFFLRSAPAKKERKTPAQKHFKNIIRGFALSEQSYPPPNPQ